MNIHVARTPHFRTGFTHTCCQGQTGSLTVRPDTARWLHSYVNIQRFSVFLLDHLKPLFCTVIGEKCKTSYFKMLIAVRMP